MASFFYQEIESALPDSVIALGNDLAEDESNHSWKIGDYVNLVYSFVKANQKENAEQDAKRMKTKEDCASYVRRKLNNGRATSTILEYARVAAHFPSSDNEEALRNQFMFLSFSHFVVAWRVAKTLGGEIAEDLRRVLASAGANQSADALQFSWLGAHEEVEFAHFDEVTHPDELPVLYQSSGSLKSDVDYARRAVERVIERLEGHRDLKVRTRARALFLQLQELDDVVKELDRAENAEEIEPEAVAIEIVREF